MVFPLYVKYLKYEWIYNEIRYRQMFIISTIIICLLELIY